MRTTRMWEDVRPRRNIVRLRKIMTEESVERCELICMSCMLCEHYGLLVFELGLECKPVSVNSNDVRLVRFLNAVVGRLTVLQAPVKMGMSSLCLPMKSVPGADDDDDDDDDINLRLGN